MQDATPSALEEALGHRFADPSLLEHALRHASTTEDRKESNERLEFLGDAILGMVVCEMIFDRFPDLLEGEMTKIKSAVVSRGACASAAKRLGLEEAMVIGKGMAQQRELPRSLAAAVFEAVIAAIYLDAGFEAASSFVRAQLGPVVERAHRSGHQQNFKSLLQQSAQQLLGEAPSYRILDEKGPDHAKCFKIAVEVGGRRFEPAWGPSKKQSEQQAALNALRDLGVIEDHDGEMLLADLSADTSGEDD